jgi:predicted nucleic acid-binding protein
MPVLTLFADTFYWIALIDPRDASHGAVLAFNGTLGAVRLITTDEVLAEVLSFFSRGGPLWRSKAAMTVHRTRSNPDMDVLPQTRADFDAALTLYEARPDKDYSLTDCRSMLAMRSLGLTEVLTNDHHFTQVRIHDLVSDSLNLAPERSRAGAVGGILRSWPGSK